MDWSTSILPRLALLCWLAAVAPAVPRFSILLADQPWTRNAEAVAAPRLLGPDDERGVELSFDGLGVRWATTFTTGEPGTWRLTLDWQPGPRGLLLELLLDGEPLPPWRDGWRPTPRRLVVELGPRWLGRGEHLLEFVAREGRDDGAQSLWRLSLEGL